MCPHTLFFPSFCDYIILIWQQLEALQLLVFNNNNDNDYLFAHSYIIQNILSNTNNSHTVIWLQMFLSNIDNLYTVISFQVTILIIVFDGILDAQVSKTHPNFSRANQEKI